jgi:acetoin utilization deacetylase AcuC-like enzyme
VKVVWHEGFLRSYGNDPAAAAGRLEPILEELEGWAKWVEPEAASEEQLRRCHDPQYLEQVRRSGMYDVAALAAGGALKAGELGRESPSFALIRPPGHHASRTRAWGFCYVNNLAVTLSELRARQLVRRGALVLDIDLHYGDGTVEILGSEEWVEVVNPGAPNREEYLVQVINALGHFQGDWIAVSAGFDNHSLDWGGLLHTRDYELIGLQVGMRALALEAGCFGVLEGGYCPDSLGESVRAFLHGLERGWTKGASGLADRE